MIFSFENWVEYNKHIPKKRYTTSPLISFPTNPLISFSYKSSYFLSKSCDQSSVAKPWDLHSHCYLSGEAIDRGVPNINHPKRYIKLAKDKKMRKSDILRWELCHVAKTNMSVSFFRQRKACWWTHRNHKTFALYSAATCSSCHYK